MPHNEKISVGACDDVDEKHSATSTNSIASRVGIESSFRFLLQLPAQLPPSEFSSISHHVELAESINPCTTKLVGKRLPAAPPDWSTQY